MTDQLDLPAPAPDVEEPEAYDAGLLSDYGGGNVEWWQDYIRAELERAHEHYAAQFRSQAEQIEALSRGSGGKYLDDAKRARLAWLQAELADEPNRPVWGDGSAEVRRNGHEVTGLEAEISSLLLIDANARAQTAESEAAAWKAEAGVAEIKLREAEGALMDRIIAAYEAGALAVHEALGAQDEPDFTEAAWDYASSIRKDQSRG